mgnify:CR=1 FL=1|tara:strand:- start:62 stop:1090 length:1029 start_codon:yes stop_codon:yes gene_type:complete
MENTTPIDILLKTALREELKESSFNNYKGQTIQLYNMVNKKIYCDDLDIITVRKGLANVIMKFNDIKNILELPEKKYKPNTIKNFINNIINVIWKIPNIDDQITISKIRKLKLNTTIKDYWLYLQHKIKNERLNNIVKDDIHIPEKEFDKVIRKFTINLKKDGNMNKKDLQDLTLLLFYRGKVIPPLRNNYATINICDKNTTLLNTENYMINDDGKNTIIINNDKVSEVYGTGIYKIGKNTTLNYCLNLLCEYRKDENKNYLLEYNNGDKMTPNGLTKCLLSLTQKYFNKHISSSQFRHIFISNLSSKLTNKKLDMIAKKMRHSLETQQFTYKNIHDDDIKL